MYEKNQFVKKMKFLFSPERNGNSQKNNYSKNKMKNFTKVFAIAIAMFGFANSSFAQATGHALASATIVTPISISAGSELTFGNIAVIEAGTVILPADGTDRTTTGGVTLPTVDGDPSPSTFTVTGQVNYTYAITLPTVDCTVTGAGDDMVILAASFTCSIPGLSGTLDGSGNQDFSVGATLPVAAAQLAGSYTSTGFDVIVNYN